MGKNSKFLGTQIKLPILTYSPYKYEVNRIKTYEIRAKRNRWVVFSPHCSALRSHCAVPCFRLQETAISCNLNGSLRPRFSENSQFLVYKYALCRTKARNYPPHTPAAATVAATAPAPAAAAATSQQPAASFRALFAAFVRICPKGAAFGRPPLDIC